MKTYPPYLQRGALKHSLSSGGHACHHLDDYRSPVLALLDPHMLVTASDLSY